MSNLAWMLGAYPTFRSWLESHGIKYVSVSLADPAVVCMDIQQLGFADESFELIVDSHALEYVADYRCALRELWRVLTPCRRMLLTKSYLFGQQGQRIWSIRSCCEFYGQRLWGRLIQFP
jgi:ubiquinone/menaquinone biosynthesis C-methylase UbiE